METLNFVELLSYGAIGLGCILAILAYLLLREEQRQSKPRKPILNSIYVFMGFSLALSVFGFGTEVWKDSNKVMELQGEISMREETIESLRDEAKELTRKLAEVEQNLSSFRVVLYALMEQKEGKVARLKELQPDSRSYSDLVSEIQTDLARIDDGIRDAIKE
ncbi:hypothetical protein [Halomonas daqiaonensis]|uniref:Uncharacterized protein n=1 Tax=Halomonas daqiaonensis TaxID=650850 RepID=A0A1H7W8J4_9GAMM|nr:hypothetical protein [Halomonas daqiaonensis]SEM17409.1 hypothetical protein SAMN04488129_13015 [Halomonas daqiaonensis]